MACHCSGCSHSKRISTFRQLQPDEVHMHKGTGKYPTKSKKVIMDRYLAARKWLINDIERYVEGRKRGYTDSWFYSRIKRNEWVVNKYKKARAEAKKWGLL